MIALVDALTCFAVPRECISILSIGCGDGSYVVGRPKVLRGGLFAWRDIIHAAMRLQSQNALGQAGLLIGAAGVVRVVAPELNHQINLDDWSRASQELPEAASTALIEKGDTVAAMFLGTRCSLQTCCSLIYCPGVTFLPSAVHEGKKGGRGRGVFSERRAVVAQDSARHTSPRRLDRPCVWPARSARFPGPPKSPRRPPPSPAVPRRRAGRPTPQHHLGPRHRPMFPGDGDHPNP